MKSTKFSTWSLMAMVTLVFFSFPVKKVLLQKTHSYQRKPWVWQQLLR